MVDVMTRATTTYPSNTMRMLPVSEFLTIVALVIGIAAATIKIPDGAKSFMRQRHQYIGGQSRIGESAIWILFTLDVSARRRFIPMRMRVTHILQGLLYSN